mgnify:CR=1 FL=1
MVALRGDLPSGAGAGSGMSESSSGGGGESAALDKAQARQRQGKADNGEDYCQRYGWYGDAECDDFCPRPDPDCAPEDEPGQVGREDDAEGHRPVVLGIDRRPPLSRTATDVAVGMVGLEARDTDIRCAAGGGEFLDPGSPLVGIAVGLLVGNLAVDLEAQSLGEFE